MSQSASHPKILEDARNEIGHVLSTVELSRAGVSKLRLVDSIVKETQRLEGVALVVMYRNVKEDATLPNGITIPKGSTIGIIIDIMRSEKTYDRASEFDPCRFYNRSQQGQEHKSQLVSATADHLEFGFGKHACPGRFSAAHEIKIMWGYILMKCEIDFMGGDEKGRKAVGTA